MYIHVVGIGAFSFTKTRYNKYNKKEVGCRDDTMPKTVGGTVRRSESMQPPKTKM